MRDVSVGWDKTNKLPLLLLFCVHPSISMFNFSVMDYVTDYCVLHCSFVASQCTYSCCVSMSCIIHDVMMLICCLAGCYCCSESQTAASLIRLTLWSGREKERESSGWKMCKTDRTKREEARGNQFIHFSSNIQFSRPFILLISLNRQCIGKCFRSLSNPTQ